jgi:hypothetical protein
VDKNAEELTLHSNHSESELTVCETEQNSEEYSTRVNDEDKLVPHLHLELLKVATADPEAELAMEQKYDTIDPNYDIDQNARNANSEHFVSVLMHQHQSSHADQPSSSYFLLSLR